MVVADIPGVVDDSSRDADRIAGPQRDCFTVAGVLDCAFHDVEDLVAIRVVVARVLTPRIEVTPPDSHRLRVSELAGDHPLETTPLCYFDPVGFNRRHDCAREGHGLLVAQRATTNLVGVRPWPGCRCWSGALSIADQRLGASRELVYHGQLDVVDVLGHERRGAVGVSILQRSEDRVAFDECTFDERRVAVCCCSVPSWFGGEGVSGEGWWD